MYCIKFSVSHVLLLALEIVLFRIPIFEAATHSLPPFYDTNPMARIIDAPVDTESRASAVANYRLPNATEPIHYDIEITTNVHTGDRNFTGKVQILLTVNENTNAIVVHARQLCGFVATIRKANTTTATEEPLNVVYDTILEFLTLTPQNPYTVSFTKGSSWVLTITYEGQLRTDNGGFYLSTYKDDLNNTHYLATTQFESTDARHAFPCYDEPAKRATFTITINHVTSLNAISNMPLDTNASKPGVSVFEKTVKMSTYLIAFVISDFEYTEGVLNNRPQRIYSRPGTKQDQEWALVSGLLILERLADYYKVDFALPKIDQVAVPDFAAGAMENWGLATYREEYMLYSKDTSTTSTQTNIANIIAHEYCHQWFGNLVAIKWWTYLWLKEGFATLFSWQATDSAYPEWDVYQIFHVTDYQRALIADGTGKTNPMTHYVQTPSEIRGRYDSISYSKAGSVLAMWQNALTDKVFRQGLHHYLTDNQYSAADELQLFRALGIAAGEENLALPATMEVMFSSWSQQSGYPLLTVTRNYDSNSFSIKQQAFSNNLSQSMEKSWYIPINYAHKSNSDFRNTTASHYLLNVKEITISEKSLAADDWLILNKQSTGFYRVNYDERNWNLIIDGLITRPYKLHPRNRAQLLNDAFFLSSINQLSHSILLKLLSYLPGENEYAPWAAANSILNTYNAYLSGDSDYNNLKRYISSLVTNIYDKLGVNDVPGEQHLIKLTRNIAINLACLAGVESCLVETNNKLMDLVNNGTPIEPNLEALTYCNGLRQSDEPEFEFVYQLLMNSSDQAQRRTLISSLGCSEKELQLRKFVESSIDSSNKLRTQERITLLSAAYSRSSIGLIVSIEFLSDNWETYANLTPGFGGENPLNEAVLGISNYVVNKDQETKYMALVEKVKHSNKVQSDLEEVAAVRINANFDWLNRNREPIMSGLYEYRASGGDAIHASLVSVLMALALMLARYL